MRKLAFYGLLLVFAAGNPKSEAGEKEPSYIVGLRAVQRDLTSADLQVRRRAIGQLKGFGGDIHYIAQALANALSDPDETVRLDAARALADIGPSAYHSAGSLARALKDKSMEVRAAAAHCLAVFAPHAPGTIPALLAAARDKSNSRAVRRRALTALGKYGAAAKRALPDLIAALDDNVEEDGNSMARSAAFALNDMGPAAAPAVPALLKCLKSEDRALRGTALQALGGIGPAHPEVLPTLLRYLKTNEPPGFAVAATMALTRIGPDARDAVPDLLAALKSCDVKKGDRCSLFLSALAQIDPTAKGVLPAAVAILSDKQAAIQNRSSAVRLIRALGPKAKEALPALVEAVREPSMAGTGLEPTLVGIGAPAAAPLAELAVNGSNYQLRGRAIRLLMMFGPEAKGVVPSLRKCLNDPHPSVRSDAAKALKVIERGQ
jgi:HEAT repeat protein